MGSPTAVRTVPTRHHWTSLTTPQSRAPNEFHRSGRFRLTASDCPVGTPAHQRSLIGALPHTPGPTPGGARTGHQRRRIMLYYLRTQIVVSARREVGCQTPSRA